MVAHDPLATPPDMLRSALPLHIGVLYLGIAGSVYCSSQCSLMQLGLDTKSADALLARLSVLAITHTHAILKTRRRLDIVARQNGVG